MDTGSPTTKEGNRMQVILDNIWWILGIIALVLVGGGFFLVVSGYGHRLLDWMKPTSDKYVPAKVFCEDRNIRDRNMKVGRYVISDDKKKRSFYLVHDLLLAKPNSNRTFLALTERAARPIDFHERITPAMWAKYPSAQRVFIDTTADLRSQASKEAGSNFMAMSLSLIAMAGAIVIVVLAIIIFFSNKGGV